jgi:hypothetical protein
VIWTGDGTVHVQFGDDIPFGFISIYPVVKNCSLPWIVPPLHLLPRLIRSDWHRKDFIIVKVKVVLAFILGELNSLKPLDGSPTDLSWDDETKRKAVVWL